MYKKDNTLTEVEAQRYNEILFYDKIRRFLTESPVNIQTRFNALEQLMHLAGSNEYLLMLIIRNKIMTNDWDYKPTKQERMVLRYRAGTPVRQSCKELHISYSTYYKMVQEYNSTYIAIPKHNEAEFESIIKFLQFLDLLTNTTLAGDDSYEY